MFGALRIAGRDQGCRRRSGSRDFARKRSCARQSPERVRTKWGAKEEQVVSRVSVKQLLRTAFLASLKVAVVPH